MKTNSSNTGSQATQRAKKRETNSISGSNGAHHTTQEAPVAEIRVVVADDHAMVRRGMISLLDSIDGITVTGEAANGIDAVAVSTEAKPDVALIDVRMSALNGADATERILEASPNTAVLAVSAHDDAGAIERMLRAGARGYVLKDTSVAIMIHAIRTLASGDIYLCPRASSRVIESFVLGDGSTQSSLLSVLTPREREVAQLLSEGHATRSIAEQLHVSIKTIDTHRYQILKKLDLRGIADLTRLALKEGLSTLESIPSGPL